MYEWPARGRAPPPASAVPGTLEAVGDPNALFPQQFHRFPEIMVVVTYKEPVPISRVRLLEEMYRSVFGKVLQLSKAAVHDVPLVCELPVHDVPLICTCPYLPAAASAPHVEGCCIWCCEVCARDRTSLLPVNAPRSAGWCMWCC